MRITTSALTAILAAVALLPRVASADLREWSLPAGRPHLSIDASAGSVRIVPGAAGHVRVLEAPDSDADHNRELSARYAVDRGELVVRARDELNVTIEVPADATLDVEMSAGRLEIGPIAGARDVRLNSGLVVLHDDDGTMRASEVSLYVLTGKIEWQRAGVFRGGLFRSFRQDGAAASRVRVKLVAGAVEIV